ncbi:DUF5988 family protein [Micromonospora sp. RTGN7]|uniref:DUF5988 family protein n=1 Tax=Micromonospora sp. RTGN7 TaxID=3016526 RepID=UPI0029FF0F1C|nr:DUF5988 family protein [Micromonospora sp. RTGN7]
MMSVTSVKIMLSGGPVELAAVDRTVPVADLGQTLKIRHGAGYEHFVRDGESQTIDGCEVAVFRWLYRTKVAE